MPFRALAQKLIEARTNAERDSLLKNVSEADFSQIALAVKEISYGFWTTEPAKTEKGAAVLKNLAERDSSLRISALADWIEGISALTKGKLELAVKKLDDAAAVFFQINKEHEAAQTQVGKLYALALLGRYDEAIEVGKKALKIFEKYGDELAAGKIEKNLGNIVSRKELHNEAEKYYLSARKRFIKLNDDGELTMCEHGLAITYSALNDFRRAEKFYASALTRARAAQMRVTQAEIETNLGNLALFRGKFDEALKFLESSRRKYETLKMPHQEVIAELEIADIYLELNLLSEAFEIYELVTKRLAALKMQGEEARARANFGRAAAALGKTNLARRELKKAERLYAAEKNKVGAAAVKLSEASLEFAANRFSPALALAEDAARLFAASKNLRRRLTANLFVGEVLREQKKYPAAEAILNETLARATKGELPNLAQSAQTSLGKTARAESDDRRAEKHFLRAIRLTETLRAPLPAEEFRMAFLASKLEAYEELAKIYIKRNELKKAFALVEDSRSRALADALGSDSPSDGNQIADELPEKLANLREELNWFYSRLNRAEPAEVEQLQRETRSREKKIAQLARQIKSANGAAAAATFGGKAALDLDKLQAQLGVDKVLLEYVAFDGKFSAFVVTNRSVECVADLCAESEILPLLEDLRFQFGALRYGAQKLNGFLAELKKRADFYLAEFYGKLLAPLENLLENRALIVVPARELHYVPFGALFDEENYAIEKREISYAPSAAIWQYCQAKPRREPENALLIAHADERIPLVNREIENLRASFRRAETLTGEAATLAAFTRKAAGFDVLHLACHGEFRPDNPLFSSLRLADGNLTVRDIGAQKLKAGLVTLSACETGLNSIYAGDEILGLARGFLTAGASSLILSLWTVNDEAAASLMQDFYRHLPAKSVAEALRLAQLKFIERGAHPYFWSPFVAIGK